MGKFLLGLATGLLLVFLTVVLLIFAAWRFSEKAPTIADNSVLVLRLQGEIPEKPPAELPPLLGGTGPRLTVSGVWTTLKKAAADSNIKAIVLEPENVAGGWAKLEEMRSDLEQFRKSGKPVYAYLRTPGGRDILPGQRRRPRLPRTVRSAHAQRTTRGVDVFQEES